MHDIPPAIRKLHDEMRNWRRHIHQHPETAFEETATAEFIRDTLSGFGLEAHVGLGKTGVAASLSAGSGTGKIALRADIDALHIHEQNRFPYRSLNDGKMHACGHDGHTAMLLGAAKYLAATRHFNGTVHFIFQPAEEGRAGAKCMIDDGLFKRFPADSVFGMHNFPDIPAGHFAVKSGPMMAAFGCFQMTISGQGTHAAMPHLGRDPVVAAAHIVTALQTLVSRNVDPADAAVVSVTQIHAGDTWNAIPETVLLRGTYRCFKPETEQLLEARITAIAESVCAGFGVAAEIVFNPENPGYPVTMNSEKESAIAARVAAEIVGDDGVDLNPTPSMGAEDFAFMLQEKPGCYVWIGNGPSAGSCLLHNPKYDFNDDILPVGAAYWVKLVETVLA
ncbi:MAG: M20 aminoacylase family protein [Gammaproteobacteria bacterium]